MISKPLLTAVLFFICTVAFSQQPGDQVTIQTIEFEGFPVGKGWLAPREGIFDFSEVNNLDIEQVLLYYTLKCDPGQTPACGEWDYISHLKVIEHTGDAKAPNFTIGAGLTPETYSYMNEPSWWYTPRFEKSITYDDPSHVNHYTLGDGGQSMTNPLDGALSDATSYYLIKADELSASGLTAGKLSGLQFNLSQVGGSLHNLRIGLKSTTRNTLSQVVDASGFTMVYSKNTTFDAVGWQALQFADFFNWDGTSNIIVSVSYTGKSGSSSTTVLGDTYDFNCSAISNETDNYLNFNGSDLLELPAEPLSSIEKEITISFWLNGNDEQPHGDSVFDSQDADGNRVLNAHLPWSNGTIYWDAGGETGTDRISKAADDPSQYKGTWNHWALTKNVATGTMHIYFNGQLWHSATGLTNDIGKIASFYLGRGHWDSDDNFYDGKLDDFAIWNKALDQATIADLMVNEITPSHPNYANLVTYFKFNENEDDDPTTTLEEISGSQIPLKGLPQFRNYDGNRVKGYAVGMTRPQLRFSRHESTFKTNTALVVDSIPKSRVMITKYVQRNAEEKPVLDAVIYKYPTYYNNYKYDENGVATDSTFVEPDEELVLEMIPYKTTDYDEDETVPWEIGRFITPYGNGLSLGNDGWTWVYDVTDFQHLLKGDKVHLRAGNFQELLDMKFVFKVGTPPRDVRKIQNLYSGRYNMKDFDEKVVEKTVDLMPDSKMFRLKTTLTGHDFGKDNRNCGEFCSNIHSIKVNGEARYSYDILQECAENPLYPQGGTWYLDRAGWCPGMPGRTRNWEITPFVNVGTDTSVRLDYDIEQDPNGNYVTEIFFVEYGDPNFKNDIAVSEIIAPSTFKLNKRFNPTCGQPLIKIKNTGGNNLTSAMINYGVEGEESHSFEWTGDLAFLEEALVELPSFPIEEYYEGARTFTVTVGNPNGAADEYPHNNTLSSTFETAPIYKQNITIEFKTNNIPAQNRYEVRGIDGSVVFQRSFDEPNTTYTDQLNLAPGCYEFVAFDTADNGMYNWPSGQGNGYINVKNADGTRVTTLQRWFGKYERYIFSKTFGQSRSLGIDNQVATAFSMYSNPAQRGEDVKIQLINGETPFTVKLYDQKGVMLFKKDHARGTVVISTEGLSSGMYIVSLETETISQTQKLIIE